MSAHGYRTELERQLRKMTLGISVGLVKDRKRGIVLIDMLFPTLKKYIKILIQTDSRLERSRRQFDPYSHFSPDRAAFASGGEEEEEDNIHKYKICEIRPPSLEKVQEPIARLIKKRNSKHTLCKELFSKKDMFEKSLKLNFRTIFFLLSSWTASRPPSWLTAPWTCPRPPSPCPPPPPSPRPSTPGTRSLGGRRCGRWGCWSPRPWREAAR